MSWIQTLLRRAVLRMSISFNMYTTFSFFFEFNFGSDWFFLSIFKDRFFYFNFLNTLIPTVLLRTIVMNELIGFIDFLKFLFSLNPKRVPFSNDFWNNLRLSHFGILMLILVVFLTRELTVHFVHRIWFFLFPHLLNYIRREKS